MISVVVERGIEGNLVSASASGHAGKGKRGTDIVCAAVTVLFRTTITVLSGNSATKAENSLKLDVRTTGRGHLAFRVTAFSENEMPLLRYAYDFLLAGLNSLSGEFPEAVEIKANQIS